jgi:hypothetical protein
MFETGNFLGQHFVAFIAKKDEGRVRIEFPRFE